jgi:hypothetical protein
MKKERKSGTKAATPNGGGHAAFEKGHPPLPGQGRPLGRKNWATILREAMETGAITERHIARAHLKQCIRGNIKAIEVLYDRLDGKAKETVAFEEPKNLVSLDEIDNINLREELLNAELAKLKSEKEK